MIAHRWLKPECRNVFSPHEIVLAMPMPDSGQNLNFSLGPDWVWKIQSEQTSSSAAVLACTFSRFLINRKYLVNGCQVIGLSLYTSHFCQWGSCWNCMDNCTCTCHAISVQLNSQAHNTVIAAWEGYSK